MMRETRNVVQAAQGRQRRGQSTLEYVLVAAAILAAIIVGANTYMKPAVQTAMQDAGNTITKSTNKLTNRLGLN